MGDRRGCCPVEQIVVPLFRIRIEHASRPAPILPASVTAASDPMIAISRSCLAASSSTESTKLTQPLCAPRRTTSTRRRIDLNGCRRFGRSSVPGSPTTRPCWQGHNSTRWHAARGRGTFPLIVDRYRRQLEICSEAAWDAFSFEEQATPLHLIPAFFTYPPTSARGCDRSPRIFAPRRRTDPAPASGPARPGRSRTATRAADCREPCSESRRTS